MREVFNGLGFTIKMTSGRKYLMGFIGSAASKEEWMNKKVAVWTVSIKTLSLVAAKWPHTQYILDSSSAFKMNDNRFNVLLRILVPYLPP